METLRLLKLVRNGDKAARDEVVSLNMGLVISIARKYARRENNNCDELEDYIQIGCIGLLKAIDNFDCSFDVKFSTYAVPVIAGEIKRYLRDNGMIKISRSIKENNIKVRRAIEYIHSTTCKEATLEDIVRESGLDKEEVMLSLDACRDIKSLNEVVYSNADTEVVLADKLQDDKDEYEKSINQILLDKMIEKLDDIGKKVIKLRYYEDKTQVEVAKLLGMSQVGVSRLEKKLLLYMRENMVKI